MLLHSLSVYVTPAVSVWRGCNQHLLYVCRIGLCAKDVARIMVEMLTWCMGIPVQGYG